MLERKVASYPYWPMNRTIDTYVAMVRYYLQTGHGPWYVKVFCHEVLDA